ncbi:MAG: hypothetical protein IIZ33_09720 [Erysipelotrichaceae bacterium]|nr:hypothetical protein [Erysipelotrichaceae bacterium]
MKWTEALRYILLCMVIYLAICLFNIFLLSPVLDMITENWRIQLILEVLLNILAAPVATFILAEKLPFRVRGLRVADGLESALKSEVELPEEKN